MKVQLTENIVAIMEECTTHCPNICDKCPLVGACCEYFTGDDSENN